MVFVVVCGGRKYNNWHTLSRWLDDLHAERTIRELMEGGASGADRLAELWCNRHPEVIHHQERAAWNDLSHDDAVIRVRADGSKYDAKAGNRRNGRMKDWLLTFPKEERLLVAFPGGGGTADMVRQAQEADIEIKMAGR